MTKVSDELYSEEWNKEENRKTMNSASMKYRGNIPDDELQRCQMIALWHSLINFKEGIASFTTYLYKCVDTQCRRYLTNNYRYYKHLQPHSLYQMIQGDNESDIEVRDAINVLPKHLKKVIVQRFYDKMTLEEIARANDYSHETARRRVKKALCQMKTILQSSYYA